MLRVMRAQFIYDAFLRHSEQPNKCMPHKPRKVITNSVWVLRMMLFMTVIDVEIPLSLNVDQYLKSQWIIQITYTNNKNRHTNS